MKIFFAFFVAVISSNTFAKELTQLSVNEILETQKRIRSFYSWPFRPEAMEIQATKVDASTDQVLLIHPELHGSIREEDSPLLEQAQKKATPLYQSWYCKRVLKKISPNFPCDQNQSWGNFGKDDLVEDLAKTWINEVTYSPEEIPTKGESERPLWSDDYWAMHQGLTSYRYSEGRWFSDYREAVESYAQPQAWLFWGVSEIEKLNSEILKWSPAEKYDLTLQDLNFSLTNEQKAEGEGYKNEEGEVEPWMGLCHGWAPASIMVARPNKPVLKKGPKDTEITWYPNDIKAMVTLAWANGSWESNFVGRRCEQKKIKKFPNGRISSESCFDNNPATFHLALGNLIGKAKASFVMDKAYDYQVWNQPVVAYQFEYFNPLDPEKKSQKWLEVASNYDKKFKNKDRFQKPLTRGKFLEGSEESSNLRLSTQDGHIKKVVGVIATVVYLVETTPPEFGPEPGDNRYARDVYLYDLEIAKNGEEWAITGGEWLQNNHPDFLFVPQKDSQALAIWDFLSNNPQAIAPEASHRSGYPLCKVVKSLVESSTENSFSYPCSEP